MLLLLVFLCIGLSTGNSNNDKINDPDLTIHIVGHTHDDPGWLITADQYYIEEVQWIFYTIIPVLKQNPSRKFTYVEMAYMHRWWEEIDNKLKNDTINLINNGQLQLNLGGWCMNDEANPTTSAIIHQMTDGNQFILNNFGSTMGRPKVAWHIDPFGHSWVTAGLWAQAGFETFGLHRINYLDLERRKLTQNLEFIWNGSSSLGEDGYIFCFILDFGYHSPEVIAYYNQYPPWVQTDPLLPSWPVNVGDIADAFIAQAFQRSLNYKHNHVLIPFGSDFAHQNAYESYVQMDKLMDYINNNSSLNIRIEYSTLYDYTLAVNRLNLTWNLEQPDFFTYVSSPHEYWSGYFTSRPILKLYVRSRENHLRVAEQYYLFAKNLNFIADYIQAMKNITFLREAIDVAQHHDAVTGTEKDAVAQEYMNQLKNGTIRMDHWATSVIGQFFKKNINSKQPELQRGGLSELLPILTKNNYIVMIVYNSLAWSVTQYLQIPTNRSDLIIYDINQNIIPSQINIVANQSQRYEYPCKYTLFIQITMKALAFETIFIGIETVENGAVIGKITQMISHNGPVRIGNINGYYSLIFDNITMRLSQIINNNISLQFDIENQFAQYQSSGGIYGDGLPNSGAYLFRPAQDNRYRMLENIQRNRNMKINLVFRERNGININSNFGFITTPHCGRDIDTETFAASICDINMKNNSFTYDFDVVNGLISGWYQRPYIDFVMFDTNNNDYGHGLFKGMITRILYVVAPNNSRNDYVMVNINYNDLKFTSLPRLLLSIRKETCHDIGQYFATIININITQSVIYIKRVEDGGTKWINNIFIDYIIYQQESFINNKIKINKEIIISISDNEKRIVHPFLIEIKDLKDIFIPNEPIILLSIQQMNPIIKNESDIRYYGYTTYATTNESFILNLYPFNSNNHNLNKNITLKINYWAFERNTLIYNVSNNNNIINTIVDGPLISEMQQVFKSNYAQTFRVYNTMNRDLGYIDNNIHIGPADEGFEVITKFKTKLNNNYEWYTNQNGLEYVNRKYKSYIDERIAGNYYPSTGQTYINDINTNYKFSTIVNQGHGVGSYKLGEYEIMLHRRCLADDRKGVNEVLNTTTHIEPQIMILMDNKENVSNLNRKLYQIQQFSHTYFFSNTIINSITDWINMYNTSWTAMNSKYLNGLPQQIFLMQFRYGYSEYNNKNINNKIILQLQHMFEINESKQYSTNITIDLNSIIKNNILNIINSTETTLTANLPLKNLNRLSWNIKQKNGKVKTIRDKYSEKQRRKQQEINDKSPIINIKPRDIRTFVLN